MVVVGSWWFLLVVFVVWKAVGVGCVPRYNAGEVRHNEAPVSSSSVCRVCSTKPFTSSCRDWRVNETPINASLFFFSRTSAAFSLLTKGEGFMPRFSTRADGRV